MQTELGPPPEDVVGSLSPFAALQMRHLALRQPRAEILPQIFPLLRIAEDFARNWSIGSGQPLRRRVIEKWIGALQGLDLFAGGPGGEISAR